jgi:hypothetical protein
MGKYEKCGKKSPASAENKKKPFKMKGLEKKLNTVLFSHYFKFYLS